MYTSAQSHLQRGQGCISGFRKCHASYYGNPKKLLTALLDGFLYNGLKIIFFNILSGCFTFGNNHFFICLKPYFPRSRWRRMYLTFELFPCGRPAGAAIHHRRCQRAGRSCRQGHGRRQCFLPHGQSLGSWLAGRMCQSVTRPLLLTDVERAERMGWIWAGRRFCGQGRG